MATPTQTRKILIKIDTSDAPKINDIAEKLGLLNKNTKNLSGNMAFLTNAFRGWLGFLGVREVVRMSDEMQNMQSRLKLATGSTEGASKALEGLLSIATRTNQSISGVGTVFNRMAIALRSSGASTQEVMSLTESLINTFRVAGATTEETTSTIVQLSQAFASGELRGQELRSVMEQNATLAGLLRDRFGGDIYKKAAEGAIGITDVLKVLYENQKRIHEEAKLLVPTFEQTLTKAFNVLGVAILNVNTNMGLASGFAKIMEFSMERLGVILLSVGVVATALYATHLPKLITGIRGVSAALWGMLLANPLVAILSALLIVLIATTKSLDDLWDKLRNVAAWAFQAAAAMREMLNTFDKWVWRNNEAQSKKRAAGWKQETAAIEDMRKKAAELGKPLAAQQVAVDPVAQMEKDMAALIEKMKGLENAKTKIPKVKEVLAALNKEYLSGAISAGKYNQKLIDFQLYKLNREFSEGKMDVFKYNEQLRDLKLEELNRQLKTGVITMEQFNTAASAEKVKVLDEQFRAGRISIGEYNGELVKLEDKFRPGAAFQAGVAAYMENIGTLSSGITKGITQAFGHLESNFLKFIETGKFNFKDFAKSILADLNAIIVRSAIIAPLAKGLLSLAAPGGGGDGSLGGSSYGSMPTQAKGGVWESGIQKFAKGGIVSGPTMFGTRSGPGLMGEAGAEAILPLGRGKNGNLGVQASVTPVNITIINQTGADVEQRERTGPNGEKSIDILITSKVREGLAKGSFDTAMKSAYGVTRKGS